MARAVNPIVVRRALLDDRADTVICVVDALDGDRCRLDPLGDRPPLTVRVADASAVRDAVEAPDVTRWRGRPLALVNERHRLLAVAHGPAEAPSRLELVAVVDLDSSSIPSADGQPGWRLFLLDPGRVVPYRT